MALNFINVVPLATEKDRQILMAAAKEDNHFPLYPTHAVLKGSEIVGSLSVCSIPAVVAWLHTQKISHRNAFEIINIGRNLGRYASGGRPLITFSPPDSKPAQYLEDLGFRKHVPATAVWVEKEYQ